MRLQCVLRANALVSCLVGGLALWIVGRAIVDAGAFDGDTIIGRGDLEPLRATLADPGAFAALDRLARVHHISAIAVDDGASVSATDGAAYCHFEVRPRAGGTSNASVVSYRVATDPEGEASVEHVVTRLRPRSPNLTVLLPDRAALVVLRDLLSDATVSLDLEACLERHVIDEVSVSRRDDLEENAIARIYDAVFRASGAEALEYRSVLDAASDRVVSVAPLF